MLSIPGLILRFLGAIEAFNEVFLNLENIHLGSFFFPKNGPKKALSNRIDALFTSCYKFSEWTHNPLQNTRDIFMF